MNGDTAVEVEPACKSAIVMESLMQRIFGSREAGRGSSDVYKKNRRTYVMLGSLSFFLQVCGGGVYD